MNSQPDREGTLSPNKESRTLDSLGSFNLVPVIDSVNLKFQVVSVKLPSRLAGQGFFLRA